MTKMNILLYLLVAFGFIGLSSCSKKVMYDAPSTLSPEYFSNTSTEKKIAYNFVVAAKDNHALVDELLGENFYSHDPKWRGGKERFTEQRNADLSYSQMAPVRIIQDDSLVAIHSRMLGDTLKFRWDILRFDGLEIQEHWSNTNDSLHLNPDGHSEIDGPTQPTDFDKTDANRALIARFMDQCMIREDGGASKFFNFGLYIQHNRDVGDGVNGLLWGMVKMKRAGHVIKFKHNYHVIAEGNFVLSATEGYVADEKTTFYDFFRIEDNKIVEHWDIIMPTKEFIYYQPVAE